MGSCTHRFQQTPLCALRPEIPTVVSAIVDRLLNKMAEDRYQSATRVEKDLEKVRQALAQYRGTRLATGPRRYL